MPSWRSVWQKPQSFWTISLKEVGAFTTVCELVEQLTDNPAARLTAQEIAERVQRAQQAQHQRKKP